MLQCLNINDIISNHFWTASCQGHEKKNLGITFNQFFRNKCYTSNSILVLFSHLYLLSNVDEFCRDAYALDKIIFKTKISPKLLFVGRHLYNAFEGCSQGDQKL